MRKLMAAGVGVALLLSAPFVWADAKPTGLYKTITKSVTVTTAQTDATLWDPDAGMHLVLQGCILSSAVAGTIELEVSDVDVLPPIVLQSGGTVTIGGTNAPIYVGAEDAILTYTTTMLINNRVSVMCWGWEESH